MILLPPDIPHEERPLACIVDTPHGPHGWMSKPLLVWLCEGVG